ncbi:MAG TPA: c-type cytochrome [Frateuria sp.]|uniref:c-type cytochrome n=1 Tax=Frateuria sp. TaxID=2211372 RepID=UPI002D7F18C7|nr:c-type cytochrome [Frateuria sp.]HET6804069.1 c-type cytochrome [Frateuria sp.]
MSVGLGLIGRVLGGALFAGAWPLLAHATSAQALVSQGNGRGAPPCQSCHGADGAGQAAAGFPRLAGLDAAYLARQLADYAGGTRADAVMQPIARALSGDERQAVAAYYGRLPMPTIRQAPRPAANGPGATLATRGRWSRRLPACEQCHGPGGVGVGPHFPPLAGQPAAYIQAQLKAWRRGTRRNDPLQLMQHVSRALSDGDMAAVAQWFAAQPLPARSGGR